MSTRSNIGVKRGQQVEMIYCHFDGYPSNNGKILLNEYKDLSKIEELIALGNISSLGGKISGGKNHSFEHREEDTVTAYMRDRGETGQEAWIIDLDTLKKDNINEYLYLFDVEANGWIWCDYKMDFKKLAQEDCM